MTRPRIVTFSRRTDGGLYIDFLVDKVRKGSTHVPNPMTGKPYTVSLRPEDVALLSVWTKAPNLVVPALEELRRTYRERLSVFVTITGYGGTWMEPEVPTIDVALEGVRRIREKVTVSQAVVWRYDPIVLTERTFTEQWHVENFAYLCQSWKGLTGRVVVSNVHVSGSYEPVGRALAARTASQGDRLRLLGYADFVDLACRLKAIANAHDISLGVCCSRKITPEHTAQVGLRNTACVNPIDLAAMNLSLATIGKSRKQRKGAISLGYAECTCGDSIDIGATHTCQHGCAYCYANRSRAVLDRIEATAPWLSDRVLPSD